MKTTDLPPDGLWARIGDLGEYHELDDLGQLAEELRELNVTGPLERRGRLGVSCAEFSGCNYISLHYGSDVGAPTRDVSQSELRELNRLLTRYNGC